MPTSIDTLKEKGRRLRIHSLKATTEAGSGHPSSCLSAADALAAHMDDIPYNTYVLLGDGECAEGSVWEAAALASYYKAANLYAIVDANGLGQSQRTMEHFEVNRFANKFRAFGWFATIVDGHNYAEIVDGFERCRGDGGSQPRVVVAKTFKGKGVSTLENLDGWHGKPIPKQDLPRALEELSNPLGPNEFKPNPRTGGPSRPRNEGTIQIDISRKPGASVATREAYGDALVK